MTTAEFWRSTYVTPRAALACAAVGVLLNAGSYLGLAMSGTSVLLVVPHLVLMVLGFLLTARIALHHSLAWRAGGERPRTTPLPPRLVWGTVAALGYLLLVAGIFVATYGEGGAELRNGQEVWMNGETVVRVLPPGSVALFDARMLRVFSSAWIFFGLLIALLSHRVEERILGYRSLSVGSAHSEQTT